jgi:hypothetical protein
MYDDRCNKIWLTKILFRTKDTFTSDNVSTSRVWRLCAYEVSCCWSTMRIEWEFLNWLSKSRCKERQSWWDEMRWNEVCDEEKRAKHFDLLNCVQTMNVQKFCLQYESRTLKKIEKKKTHDHLIVDYSLFHDHVQTQSFCVLYVFRTNAQNSLSLILYLMMTFRRRISVFCMSFVRMFKILYLWFFISWWRSDAEFLCFVCLSYECSKFFIFDSLSHDHILSVELLNMRQRELKAHDFITCLVRTKTNK